MLKMVEFPWWWKVTKSPRAAALIEAYWLAPGGNRAIELMDEHKNERGLTKAKQQVRWLKKPLERLGYRLFWRVQNGKILGWVTPTRVDPVKPPSKTRSGLRKVGFD